MRGLIVSVVLCAFVATAAAEPERVRRPSRVAIAQVLVGTGLLATATGFVFGLVARSRYNEQFDNGNCLQGPTAPQCNTRGYADTSSARTLGNVGTAIGVTGVLVIATGTTIYVTAPKDAVVVSVATRF